MATKNDTTAQLKAELTRLRKFAVPRALSFAQDFGLAPSEDKLIQELMKHAGKPRTREQLHHALYQERMDAPSINIIDSYVKRIRSKMAPNVIATIYKEGYYVPLDIAESLIEPTGMRLSDFS